MNLKRFAPAGILFALGLFLSGAAFAQFPTRTVTLVVPFPPGGGTDTGARLVATKLGQKWKQVVIVDNKPGAAGLLGADFVSKAKPDGYTLMMGNIGTQSINPSLYKKISYNPDTAFAPVTLVAELPLVMLTHASYPAKSARDVIAMAKAQPGKITYSSSGPGGSMHLAGALFESASGTEMLHIPYKGGGPAIADLIVATSTSPSPPCSRAAGISRAAGCGRWPRPAPSERRHYPMSPRSPRPCCRDSTPARGSASSRPPERPRRSSTRSPAMCARW